MNIKDLEKLIKEELVSNKHCYISKNLILANEGYYVVDKDFYVSEECFTDKSVSKIFDGEFNTIADLDKHYENHLSLNNKDDDDHKVFSDDPLYYYTENCDEEEMIDEIIENGYFFEQSPSLKHSILKLLA